MNITQILLGVIILLGGVFALFIRPYIQAHVTTEQLSLLFGIAKTVVFAAEQIFGAKMGQDKLAYALNLAKRLLESKGITFDEDTIRAAIEAQVKALNEKNKPADNGSETNDGNSEG